MGCQTLWVYSLIRLAFGGSREEYSNLEAVFLLPGFMGIPEQDMACVNLCYLTNRSATALPAKFLHCKVYILVAML